jgi:hypothetical protein
MAPPSAEVKNQVWAPRISIAHLDQIDWIKVEEKA